MIVRSGQTTEKQTLTQELTSVFSNQQDSIDELERLLGFLDFHLTGNGDADMDEECKERQENPCMSSLVRDIKTNSKRVNSLVGAIKTLVKDNI